MRNIFRRNSVESSQKSPWKFLSSYQEGDTIYGRDREINLLYDSIYNNTHTIIYGKTGVGKTSLLQAGLFPLVRKAQFFPVIIRLGQYEGNWVEYTISEILASADDAEKKPKLYPEEVSEPLRQDEPALWSFINRTGFKDSEGKEYIPLLIFDQFEEVVRTPGMQSKAIDFLKELYLLVDDSIEVPAQYLPYSNFRILISLREDYLCYFDDIVETYHFNEFKDNRTRIKSFSPEQIKQIILFTMGDKLAKGTQDEVCSQIIEKIQIENDRDFGQEIHSGVFSLVCSTVYELPNKEGYIDSNSVAMVDEWIYKQYNKISREVGSDAVLYIEKKLISVEGYRNAVSLSELLSSNKISKKQVDLLVKKHILQYVTIHQTECVEFVHDIYVKIIRKLQNLQHSFLSRAWGNDIMPGINFLEGLTRFQYNKWSIITYLKLVAVVAAAILSFPDSVLYSYVRLEESSQTELFAWVMLLESFIVFSIIYYGMSYSIRRVHDAGYSAKWLFVPFYNLYILHCKDSALNHKRDMFSNRSLFMNISFKHLCLRWSMYGMSVNFGLSVWATIDNCHADQMFGDIGLMFLLFFVVYMTVFYFQLPRILKSRLEHLHIPYVYAWIPVYNYFLWLYCFKQDEYILKKNNPDGSTI